MLPGCLLKRITTLGLWLSNRLFFHRFSKKAHLRCALASLCSLFSLPSLVSACLSIFTTIFQDPWMLLVSTNYRQLVGGPLHNSCAFNCLYQGNCHVIFWRTSANASPCCWLFSILRLCILCGEFSELNGVKWHVLVLLHRSWGGAGNSEQETLCVFLQVSQFRRDNLPSLGMSWAVTILNTKYRWCLTGTPIINGLSVTSVHSIPSDPSLVWLQWVSWSHRQTGEQQL